VTTQDDRDDERDMEAPEREPAGENGSAGGTQEPAAAGPAEIEPRTLAGYVGRLWSQVRSGQSGVLPVLLGVVLIGIIFQSLNAKFLSPGNLINLLVQGAVYMLLGMGEVFVLLLGEIDLSLGFVGGIGATVVTMLLQQSWGWPWYGAVFAALVATSAIGAFHATLITRLHLPSFIVTLGGLLGWQGVMILLLGQGGTIPIQNSVVNGIANGTLSRLGSWIVVAVVVLLFAGLQIVEDGRRRASGLHAPPRFLTYLKILLVAAAGVGIVLIANVDRGVGRFKLYGLPYVLLLVFFVLVLWSLVLGRTRFGRYVYAIGGSAEAARRAGINLAMVRTVAFTLGSLSAGIGGIVYASRLRSISTSFDGGTIVLYVVATAVIGGTSLFGGRGHPLHAVIGGIVIAAIVNGMSLLGARAAIQFIATAVVLVASITVDVVVRRRTATARQ
jgi:D-xylose transport system permease protein